jgi:hypothetical protein
MILVGRTRRRLTFPSGCAGGVYGMARRKKQVPWNWRWSLKLFHSGAISAFRFAFFPNLQRVETFVRGCHGIRRCRHHERLSEAGSGWCARTGTLASRASPPTLPAQPCRAATARPAQRKTPATLRWSGSGICLSNCSERWWFIPSFSPTSPCRRSRRDHGPWPGQSAPRS